MYPASANSVDPDQLASEEANWSGSALFVIHDVNLYQQPRSTGWKLEVGVTYNICFSEEIRKILCGYPLLSGAMHIVTFQQKILIFFFILHKHVVGILIHSAWHGLRAMNTQTGLD